jgi:hypothetical protein
MRRSHAIAAVLCSVQMLGVCGAVIAAAVEIESILITGPIFSVLGLVAAFWSVVCRSGPGLLFGLSASLISFFLLVLIPTLNWSPNDAQFPVTAMLFCYQVFIIPIGLVALYQMLAKPIERERARPWQFSLRSLVLLTALVAIGSAVTKIAYDVGAAVLPTIAVGLAVASVIAAVLVLCAALVSWHSAERAAQ